MADPIITTAALNMSFGSVQALQDVDLQVPAGRIGLVGANGAGKSTLIKILLGMLTPDSGTSEVYGTSAQRHPLAVRSRVGYMPEGDCFPPDQTAADFVSYTAELGGLPASESRQRASEVLTLVGLAEERFRNLGEFSTGMKQRAKLAQAIVHSPELVLLDEPASGLDPDGREDMLNLINRLGSFGMSVVFSSHVLGDIERTCDWVVMLNEGRLLRNEPLAAIRASNAVRVVLLDDPAPAVAALEARGATVAIKDRMLDVELIDGDPFVLIRDVLAETRVGLRSLGSKQTTLEDVYLAEEEFSG
ncbi:MAG: ABC transporter ATP-binding protein [Acidimicrobiia bacterium]|nr:ABC transporter ATP-binding protein [Acidimicrobiia bacterium]MBT8216119.1 ABC transporter ATP-binding protein [Acidimicrobiia bacterium]NNF09898.1 ABC transporter ATP-binding protein [Acidimicrobiia bacterium]NNL70525.1 ABC transporter ATP-binding protein [Acidimicrobiia bacterium]